MIPTFPLTLKFSCEIPSVPFPQMNFFVSLGHPENFLCNLIGVFDTNDFFLLAFGNPKTFLQNLIGAFGANDFFFWWSSATLKFSCEISWAPTAPAALFLFGGLRPP